MSSRGREMLQAKVLKEGSKRINLAIPFLTYVFLIEGITDDDVLNFRKIFHKLFKLLFSLVVNFLRSLE